MILVVALCFPIFLVTVFDTGILYQVAVFVYGALNGLFVQKLGQVITWSDLVRSFDTGVTEFQKRMMSAGAHERWGTPETRSQYFQWEAMRRRQLLQEIRREPSEIPAVPAAANGRGEAIDNRWSVENYRKWTPFAYVWDVRPHPAAPDCG